MICFLKSDLLAVMIPILVKKLKKYTNPPVTSIYRVLIFITVGNKSELGHCDLD